MSIRIGLYDFFAYTLPGVFYILVVTYGLAIFGFININLSMLSTLSLLSFLILIGAGYIVGLLMDPIAYKWARLFQKRNREVAKLAFEEFCNHHPQIKMSFKSSDWGILLRTIKSSSIEAAMDIEQHNVASVMLRNISLGLIVVSAIYLLFFFSISSGIWNLILAGISFSFSIIAINRSKIRRHWFYIAIFEAIVAHYLLQKEWTGDKSYLIYRNYENEMQERSVSNSMLDSEVKSVESE